jgi:transglutaminase-like putative cysteine protease
MRSSLAVSALLIGAGIGIFLYKVFVLGYPLSIAEAPGTWRVDFVVTASGEQRRATVEVPLPRSSSYQTLLSEAVRSGRFRFSIAEEDGDRRGRWSGKIDGATTLSYEVTFNALPYSRALPGRERRTEYPKSASAFLSASPGIQRDDPVIIGLGRELLLDGTDKVKLVRNIYDFVGREIGPLRTTAPMDAVSVVQEGRGNALGRARLFCALARLNGLPCRVVMGVPLERGTRERFHYWNEAYLGDGWVPFDVAERRAEHLPPNRLVLSNDASDTPIVSSGTSSLAYRFDLESQLETYADLVERHVAASPSVVDRLSPLFLPVRIQYTLRFLLLVPLGALAMAVLRNVVGLRTFGMFMPMLIALAFTHTGLAWGTLFLFTIITFALFSRLWIRPLHLLLAPRIAFILTLVVLLMLGVMLAGERAGIPSAGVGAFPFVIMTMIVERISVSLEEEGWSNTLRRVGSTIVAIYITFAVIQARVLQTFFLVFPEFLVAILGLLVLVGRYTGYRLTELARFRHFAARE